MKILITIGDCNGIGIETMLKALDLFYKDKMNDSVQIDIIGRLDVIREYAELIDFPLNITDNSLNFHGKSVNIIECKNTAEVFLGKVSRAAGHLAAEAIERGVAMTLAGEYDALVTMPVSKFSLYMAGWKYPGHTEMLAKAASKDGSYLMILFNNSMRVALTTIHIPLSQVSRSLNKDMILDKLFLFNESLIYDFNIESPTIAVLGLNPHAGEDGAIGNEEQDFIIPAVNAANSRGMNTKGPFPGDGFFAHDDYKNYDGILAMYHDQGLIPLKLLAQGAGVNYTAGLQIVRTSPDHGTAFSIAGQNIANPQSSLNAIKYAVTISRNRLNKTHNKLNQNYNKETNHGK